MMLLLKSTMISTVIKYLLSDEKNMSFFLTAVIHHCLQSKFGFPKS